MFRDSAVESGTMADLLKRLGGISQRRVRMQPVPGTATERDVLKLLHRTDRLCEIIDDVFVEKTLGYTESFLTLWLGFLLQSFLQNHASGPFRRLRPQTSLQPTPRARA
jgi:hypothetical protein